MHELLHALGADHSQMANVMHDSFDGVNNRGNSTPDLPCVLPRVNSVLAAYTLPPPGMCG